MTESPDRSESTDLPRVGSSAPGLADDRLYRALASRRRRRILYFLLDRRDCSVEEIVTVLAGWRVAETGRMSSPADRQTISVGVRHTDLPLLVDVGLVTRDADDDTVRINPLDAPVVDLILESIEIENSSVR